MTLLRMMVLNMRRSMNTRSEFTGRVAVASLLLVWGAWCSLVTAQTPARLKLLFLGDQGHHRPARFFESLQPAMRQRGIELTYTEKPSDLNPQTLNQYAGLVIYANIDEIAPDQEQALLDYVASGRGFIPLHCASFCFRNSPKYVALVGAQFQRHGTGTFRVEQTAPGNPLLQGYRGFESWDETYVHTQHNEQDRTVLEVRDENGQPEPWTWIREQGKGRVFYTAWGHDERTWNNPGFQNLVERGIRWAVGTDPTVVPPFMDRPEMTPLRKDVKPLEFANAVIPFYPPGKDWGKQDGPITKVQKPLDPEESLKHAVTPVGFKLELFASEPDIGKPLAMNWDERGRLWVCESIDYPNDLRDPDTGNDRIRICEDTDGDGKADKFTVFAEKLSIPAAIAFHRGGAIVQDGTRTLYLKDTDGDDKADVRKVLITGWNMRDTHGGVSNFQYGIDNWFYGMQGYNDSQPTFNGQSVQSFRQGFFRFKLTQTDPPEVAELEFLRSTNNNTWGLGFSEEGLVFGSTANGNPSEYLPIPNRYYEAVRGWSSSVLGGIAESNKFEPIAEQIRQVDHHGGFTAAAGHALYTARAWPEEYWNRTAFVCEPTGHLIATFVITPQGAGFRSKNSWNIYANNEEWAAPIMAEVGPDGQLWIADWYNPIIQHNPTPAGYKTGKGNAYEIDLRDKKHGRIYRVVHTPGEDLKPQTSPLRTLAGASSDELIAALGNDNFFWRRHAQRLLVEAGPDSGLNAAPLFQWLQRLPDAHGTAHSAIHALGTIHGLGMLSSDQLLGTGVGGGIVYAATLNTLKHPAWGVRRMALQVLPANLLDHEISGAILEHRLLADPHPQVRLAALLKLSECDANPALSSALAALLRDESVLSDRWLRDGLVAAGAKNAQGVLVELSASHAPLEPRARDLAAIIAQHYGRGAPTGEVQTLLAELVNAAPETAEVILAGLAQGWPKDQPVQLSDEGPAQIIALLKSLTPAGQASLITLATSWKVPNLDEQIAEIASSFLESAQNAETDDTPRIAAVQQYVDLRRNRAETAAEVLELVTPRTTPELSRGFLEALARSDSPATGEALAAKLAALTPGQRSAALRVLLTRVDWSSALLDAIDRNEVPLNDLALDQKQALAAHPDKKLAERAKMIFTRGGGLPNADRQKVIDELLPLTKLTGNATAGKVVYTKQCSKCHTHSGEGGKVGPDLTGMSVHPKHELLIHLIDPSRSVEGNFRVYTVVLVDGRVLNGLLASESKTSIEIVDAEAKKHAIQREDIEELVASTKSLMPEGFEKQVSTDDIKNLLEFLTQRGKYIPIPLDKVATVVTTKGMFFEDSGELERLIFPDWKPKVFEGVPFVLVDPQGDRLPNAIMLRGPHGLKAPRMPQSVTLPCHAPGKAIHLLSGVGGWSFPAESKGSVSMIVRLHYADGSQEDHPLMNGEHFADYIRRVDVPGSKFAYDLSGRQIRYLSVQPKKKDVIETIELVKGPDNTAPVVMAVTVEQP